MAYSAEERVFVVKTFYHTSSFVTAQKTVSEEIQQEIGTSKICTQPSGTDV
jgi:hypothetical protein